MEEVKRASGEENVARCTDLSDITEKLQSGCHAYTILLNEFKVHRILLDHTIRIRRGSKTMMTTKKQEWIHKYPSYEFMWQKRVGKEDFEKDLIYKAARKVVGQQRGGSYER